MSEKQWKRKRRHARLKYEWAYGKWSQSKPPKILFIRWLKWRRSEPRREDYV